MSIDSKIIIILGLCAMLVMMLDDRVSERWCDAYQFCEDTQIHGENHE